VNSGLHFTPTKKTKWLLGFKFFTPLSDFVNICKTTLYDEALIQIVAVSDWHVISRFSCFVWKILIAVTFRL